MKKVVIGFENTWALTEEFGGKESGISINVYGKVTEDEINAIQDKLDKSEFKYKAIREFDSEKEFEKYWKGLQDDPHYTVNDCRRNNTCDEKVEVDRYFKPLRGASKEIRETINTIVDTDPSFNTSYVMGVDDNDECLWCCHPGDYDDRTRLKSKELKKVYVWLSNIGCKYPIEGIYQR